MTVYSFCPTRIQKELDKIKLKNKGDFKDLEDYRKAWVQWINRFSGAENKKQWAITNGIHDAITHQIAHVYKRYNKIYWFNTDYRFYKVLVRGYNNQGIDRIDQIEPNSYVLVSQPNHEGGVTDWFPDLIKHCETNGSKIFLDCAFYGTTFDILDTSLEVFDAVAFSLSKNFLLGGARSGIVFSDDLPLSLTVPIQEPFGYSYFNSPACEIAKHILPKFGPTYITNVAKPIQEKYCIDNNLRPADIWMWAFDGNEKICITDQIRDLVQHELDNESL
jgi:histidinol-phosphate/aromatic aminotransferase/cobyric acid decarboxylase-like protein